MQGGPVLQRKCISGTCLMMSNEHVVDSFAISISRDDLFSDGDLKSETGQKILCHSACECLHAFSIGNVDKMFEVWIDVKTRSFVFR